MAFDGHQTNLRNSLFQMCQRQTGVNVSGKSDCMPVPFIPKPVTSCSEHLGAYWSQESQDDPYELSYAQSAIKRKPSDANCDGEADLQGLVSDILDEADAQDSFYSESLPTCNPIWSPKTSTEELLQYFQPEPKTFNNPCFISNHLPHETFSKAQQQSVDKEINELSQLSSGLAGNQQWSFNLLKAGSYSIHPQKLPPGLPLSNKVTADLSQMQQYKHIGMPTYNSRGNDTPLKNFPVVSDIFRPQNDANDSCLDLCEDHYNQKSVNQIFNEHCVPEDMNQLVSSFRSFMPSDHDSSCRGDFLSMHKPVMDMLGEEGLAQQFRKIYDPAVSTQNSPVTQTQKQLFGHLELMQNGRIGEVRKQKFKHNDFQDPSEFNLERMEYFRKPKAFSGHLSFQNQNKIMHRENHHLSMNQYSKQYTRQSQKKSKPQMDKENKKMQVPGFTEEGFTRRQTNTRMAEGDIQHFLQNPYFDFQGNMQAHRRDGEDIMISAGNVQQFTPHPHSLNDLRRYSNMAIKSNLSSRSVLPCENRGPHMDMSCMRSTNDAVAFNSFISDMKNHRGESTYHGMASAATASLMMNQGPAFQLHLCLDECYDQWKSLETERKKTELILKKAFPGKTTSMITNANPPKPPPRPRRVDYLIVNHMKEQANVTSLFDRMEYLCGVPLHSNIHAVLKMHHMAVCITQTRCKEDIGNMTKQQQGINFTEDRDHLLMVMALKDLAATTKRLRTALWCALQMTMPKPVKIQDHDAYEEDTSSERCSSPFPSYFFCL